MSLGIAKRVRRLDLAKHWPEIPKGGDISDWLARGHTREQLDTLIAGAPDYQADAGSEQPPPQADQPPPRFKLVPFDKIALQTAPAYLVEGLIPRVGLIVIWGPMKCGKSFWTFDLVMHVALGWSYRERKVRQGEVVYLSLEGNAGFNRRAEGFRQQHKITDAPFYLITDRTNLVQDHRTLIAAIKAASVKPAAMVIDTLNRSLAGSESKDEDMGAYVKAADAVCEAFACAVIIIHHCGVDENRPRGHTSLGGAVDAQLAVHRDTANNIITEVEWMKDGDTEGNTMVSKLERVEVGVDDDGNELSSCVVVPVEDTAPATTKDKRKKLSKADATALRALHEAIDEVGTTPPASNHIPANIRTTTLDQWRNYAYRMGISTGEQRAKEMAFKRASERLIGDNRVAVWEQEAWPVS
jgi:AAA domain